MHKNLYGLAALAGVSIEAVSQVRSPLELPYTELPGAISARALEEHYRLYLQYIETLGSIWERLEGEPRPAVHDHASAYRALKLEEPYACNGVALHELYFSGLTPEECQETVPTAFRAALSMTWLGLDGWWAEMCAAGEAADGWALTIIDPCSKELCVVAAQSHHIGIPVNKVVLVAVDVFEHAFWMDHGTNRADYLDGLFPYLHWEELERRYAATL